MTKRKLLIRKLLYSLAFFIMFSACEDKMDEHYDAPEWLKGSAWEVLEAQKNYSIFLKASDMGGFRPILEGKSLVTVMAPNDDVFSIYITENNKTSIEDFTTEELRKIIGYHIMYYSYDKDMLINFRPYEGDGATEDELLESAGLYYKHRTRSSDVISIATDENGKEISIFHNDRLLPIFSSKLFQTKGIEAKSNYEYFYPNSTWTGDEGFNVSNASVDEYELVADNGYVYLVDKVVEPLETIYTELKNRSDYSTYINLYDKYTYYVFDEQLTTDFGNGTDLYLHNHDPLPNIACEWLINDYRALGILSKYSYSVFAPSNNALDAFFKSYWEPGGFSSLDDVSSVAMTYLLYNSVYASSIVFPEEINNGELENSFAMPINFDVDKVSPDNRVMCLNGALYGLDQLDVPGMFMSVSGPAFRYKDYSYYLNMLDASNMLVGLSSDETLITTLIPSNEQMINSGISLINDVLSVVSEGEVVPMGNSAMTNIVNLNTVTGGSGISTTGIQVLNTNNAFTYWFIKDGKITTSVLFNDVFLFNSIVPFVEIEEIKYDGSDWSNGKAYSYKSDVIFESLGSASVQSQLAVMNDMSFPYCRFAQLLKSAGLVDVANQSITFLNGIRSLMFIPTNEVINNAILAGKIPGVNTDGSISDTAALANYLKCYFILTESNGITTYPYVGSGISGEYTSLGTYSGNGVTGKIKINISDNGSSLSIKRVDSETQVNVIPDYNYFPFAFDDGGVHYIDGVL